MLPADAANPFYYDNQLRRNVLLRHFAEENLIGNCHVFISEFVPFITAVFFSLILFSLTILVTNFNGVKQIYTWG